MTIEKADELTDTGKAIKYIKDVANELRLAREEQKRRDEEDAKLRERVQHIADGIDALAEKEKTRPDLGKLFRNMFANFVGDYDKHGGGKQK